MTLAIKDGNTQLQSISTQTDVAGSLVPVNVPASVVGNVATPASSSTPLPVINAAGSVAVDGSGTITTGGSAQALFGGITPSSGFLVCNNSSGILYVSDVGAASAGGSSIQIGVAATFNTPSGYRPGGAVSIFGALTGQAFAARRW